MNSTSNRDPELEAVANELERLDPDGLRTGRVLRKTLDQLYDGQRTGRFRWDQLYKTENTHCGTLVEINLQRELHFRDGQKLDYCIVGIEVDCKYSQSIGGWMIPREAVGHLCLLVWADDVASEWSLGLIRISDEILNPGRNLDSKKTISAASRSSIHWLFDHEALPPNALLKISQATVDAIMVLPSGQQRVNQIFRVAAGLRIGRSVIATLAQQVDYMKRIRGNGGARTALKAEGYIILGQYEEHRRVAQELGVEIPGDGESVSVRVARAPGPGTGTTQIDRTYWRVATESDPIAPAPDLPHT